MIRLMMFVWVVVQLNRLSQPIQARKHLPFQSEIAWRCVVAVIGNTITHLLHEDWSVNLGQIEGDGIVKPVLQGFPVRGPAIHRVPTVDNAVRMDHPILS